MQYQAMLKAWEAKHNGIANAIKDATKKGRDTKDLERRLIDIEKEKPQPPKVQRLVYNDATPEALIHKLAKTYPAGGVISSEAGIVFGGHGMSKETIMRNLATFNSLWDGLTYRSDRQSVESCTLRGARLTVALQVQKTVILEFFDRAKDLPRGSGFLARYRHKARVFMMLPLNIGRNYQPSTT
jgi:putative DNA primase/helicase